MPRLRRAWSPVEDALIGVLIILALTVLPNLLYLAIVALTGNVPLAAWVSVGAVFLTLIGGSIILARRIYPD